MSIEGQGHFFTIYFPGFVCFVLYLAKISGERLQDHWSSGFLNNSKPKYCFLLKAISAFIGVNNDIVMSKYAARVFSAFVLLCNRLITSITLLCVKGMSSSVFS